MAQRHKRWLTLGVATLATTIGATTALHIGTTSATVASVPEAADHNSTVLEKAGLAEAQGRERGAIPLEHYHAQVDGQDYVDRMATSEKTLTRHLRELDYSRAAINYATNNLTVDYQDEAKELAGLYMQAAPMTVDTMRQQLNYEGFDPEHVEAAIKETYKKGGEK